MERIKLPEREASQVARKSELIRRGELVYRSDGQGSGVWIDPGLITDLYLPASGEPPRRSRRDADEWPSARERRGVNNWHSGRQLRDADNQHPGRGRRDVDDRYSDRERELQDLIDDFARLEAEDRQARREAQWEDVHDLREDWRAQREEEEEWETLHNPQEAVAEEDRIGTPPPPYTPR